jgi:hypothetical protein
METECAPHAFSDTSSGSVGPHGGPSVGAMPGANERVKFERVVGLARTSQLGLIAAIALITGGLIFTGVSLLDNADRNRRAQVAVREVEADANLISRLHWETKASRRVTSRLRAELRLAESKIARTTQALAESRDHTPKMLELRDTCSRYVGKVNREIASLQAWAIRTGEGA